MTASQENATVRTSCCIAGGGPAGMMLGFLLARAGIDVVVLEKHADFLRDFRGDTIHPSTLDLMYELGLLAAFLQNPHQKVRRLSGQVGETKVEIADFSHLPTHCNFIAFMPQWDFLNFLVERGTAYPGLHVRMQSEVTGLVEENGGVKGIKVETPDGPLEVRADLVIGADGRHSTVRKAAGFEPDHLGAPMDVLWFRLPRKTSDANETFGHLEAGRMMIMLNRDDYWQCAYLIPKGGFGRVRAKGIEAFQQEVARLTPSVADRVGQISDWADVSLLTVAVDRLRQWYKPGLLCIGDAAHAMSPIGGVGINLAVQDAVAAANILAPVLAGGAPGQRELAAVQRRRMFPARFTQRLQLVIQNRLIGPVLESERQLKAPWFFKLLQIVPALQRIPARIIGIGIRPEHIHTSDAQSE